MIIVATGTHPQRLGEEKRRKGGKWERGKGRTRKGETEEYEREKREKVRVGR